MNQEVTKKAAQQGYANATELADYLVDKGIPFRTAHDISGQAVVKAIEKGLPLEDLSVTELQALHPSIEDDIYPWLALDAVLDKRGQLGGTNHKMVMQALYVEYENVDKLKASLDTQLGHGLSGEV